jgi:hypothetical protein
VTNQHNFKRLAPIWGYFSGDGYDSRILKDFNLIDDKQYQLFVRLLCQNKDIWPSHSNIKMEIEHFDKHSYQLLGEDRLFELLKKMAVPLQMKHWELKVPSENNVQNLTPRQLHSSCHQEDFKNDVFFRWKTYFSFVKTTIQDLENASFLSVKSKKEIEILPDRENQKKALFLQEGLKKSLDGVPEYLVEREACWCAKEQPLINLFLHLSRVFDISEKRLTLEEFLSRELKMLDLVDRSVIWSISNDKNGKVAMFDYIPLIRQDVCSQLRKEQDDNLSKAISNLLRQRMEGHGNERD